MILGVNTIAECLPRMIMNWKCVFRRFRPGVVDWVLLAVCLAFAVWSVVDLIIDAQSPQLPGAHGNITAALEMQECVLRHGWTIALVTYGSLYFAEMLAIGLFFVYVPLRLFVVILVRLAPCERNWSWFWYWFVIGMTLAIVVIHDIALGEPNWVVYSYGVMWLVALLFAVWFVVWSLMKRLTSTD